jgi:hypothetical protein
MNERIKIGERAFATEHQNEPPEDDKYSGITPELVASRLSLYPHMIAPPGQSSILVQFIDVAGREIHYGVYACAKDVTGSFIDYGIIKVANAPKGNLRNPPPGVEKALEIAVMEALCQRREEVRAGMTEYKDMDGNSLDVMVTLVDSRYLKKLICLFCAQSGPRYLPTMGHQHQPSKEKYRGPTAASKALKQGEQWHAARDKKLGGIIYHVDADYWKHRAHERFLQAPGTPGAATLFGNNAAEHERFSKHICAEEWDIENHKWIKRSRWNHFLDVAAGCLCAASICGARLKMPKLRPEGPKGPPKPKKAFGSWNKGLRDWGKRR